MSAFSGFCHFVLRSICLLGWLAKHKNTFEIFEQCLGCERDAQQKIKTKFQGIFRGLLGSIILLGRLGCERKQNLCVLIPEHLKQCSTGEGTKSFHRTYQKFLSNLHWIVHILLLLLLLLFLLPGWPEKSKVFFAAGSGQVERVCTHFEIIKVGNISLTLQISVF